MSEAFGRDCQHDCVNGQRTSSLPAEKPVKQEEIIEAFARERPKVNGGHEGLGSL